jgi:hypothetical protein
LIGIVVHDAPSVLPSPRIKKHGIDVGGEGMCGDIADLHLRASGEPTLTEVGLCKGDAARIEINTGGAGVCAKGQQITTAPTTHVDDVGGISELLGTVLGYTFVAGLLEPRLGEPQLVPIVELGEGLVAHADKLKYGCCSLEGRMRP